MKYCTKCGEQMSNKATACPKCGCTPIDKKTSKSKKRANPSPITYCTKCGGRISIKAIICPHCGCFSIGRKTLKNPNDKINLGLCLVALLIPLFGLIYWPVKHKEFPEKAQAVGIMSVVSSAFWFAVSHGLIHFIF